MVCHTVLRLTEAMYIREDTDISQWGFLPKLWQTAVPELCRMLERNCDDRHEDLGRQCLALIGELEPCPVDPGDGDAFLAWAQSFREEESAFSDDLIKALMAFSLGEENELSARARRTTVVPTQSSASRTEGPTPSPSIGPSPVAEELPPSEWFKYEPLDGETREVAWRS